MSKRKYGDRSVFGVGAWSARCCWFMANSLWDIAPARETGITASFLQPLDLGVAFEWRTTTFADSGAECSVADAGMEWVKELSR